MLLSDAPGELLIVAAHADDETLGAGGTVAALAAAGWQVTVGVATDGRVHRAGAVVDNRAACEEACKILGVSDLHFLGFPDQRLDVVAEAELADAVRSLPGAPQVVITHEEADRNADHRQVHAAVQIAHRPGPGAPDLLAMEVPGSTGAAGQAFRPSAYIDVTAWLDTKVRALRCYEDELRPWPHPRSDEGIRVVARRHGIDAGCDAAEAFRVMRCGLAGNPS